MPHLIPLHFSPTVCTSFPSIFQCFCLWIWFYYWSNPLSRVISLLLVFTSSLLLSILSWSSGCFYNCNLCLYIFFIYVWLHLTDYYSHCHHMPDLLTLTALLTAISLASSLWAFYIAGLSVSLGFSYHISAELLRHTLKIIPLPPQKPHLAIFGFHVHLEKREASLGSFLFDEPQPIFSTLPPPSSTMSPHSGVLSFFLSSSLKSDGVALLCAQVCL